MILVHTWRRTVPPNDLRFEICKLGAHWVDQSLTLDEALELRTRLTEALEAVSPKPKEKV